MDDDGDWSDGELLTGSASRSELFAVLYQRHVDAVVAYFYRRTGCAQTAADLTAETFAQAFTSRHRFVDVGAPARAGCQRWNSTTNRASGAGSTW